MTLETPVQIVTLAAQIGIIVIFFASRSRLFGWISFLVGLLIQFILPRSTVSR